MSASVPGKEERGMRDQGQSSAQKPRATPKERRSAENILLPARSGGAGVRARRERGPAGERERGAKQEAGAQKVAEARERRERERKGVTLGFEVFEVEGGVEVAGRC